MNKTPTPLHHPVTNMSFTSRNPRVIFIGNIPFEITEEQLIDIFKEVGPVQSFRLMFDRETGRSRGYAFCEYADAETAASAIRNLTGYEIGGRHLKVDKADNDMLPSSVIGNSTATSTSTSSSGNTGSFVPSVRPVQTIPGTSQTASTAAIHSILSAPPFTNPQSLLELLASLKATVQTNPEQARHLLGSNPGLSYALLQSFISLGLIDMSTVQSLLLQSQQNLQQQQQQQPPQQTQSNPPNSSEQQRALIMQIMAMTPEQINLLPAQQREQVLQVKQQILQQQQQQQLK